MAKDISWRKFPLALVAFAAGSVCYLRFHDGLWSIYQDALLGMLFVGAYAVYREDEPRVSSAVKAMPVLFAMALVKETGIALALLVWLIMFVDAVSGSAATRKPQGSRRPVTAAVLLALSPVVAWLSWQVHLQAYGLSPDSSGNLLHMLSAMISSGLSAVQRQTANAFASALVTVPIGSSSQGTKWLVCAMALLAAIVVCFVFLAAAQRDGVQKRRMWGAFATTLFAVLAFMAGLAYLEIDIFVSPKLPSYWRYAGTIFAGALGIALYLLVRHAAQANSSGFVTRLVAAALALVVTAQLYYTLPYATANVQHRPKKVTARIQIAGQTQRLMQVAQPGEHVYAVWQNATGPGFYMTRYMCYPLRCNVNDSSLNLAEPGQWAQELAQGYQYVYIGAGLDEIRQNFAGLFSSAALTSDAAVYRVKNQNGKVMLEPLE